MSLCSTVTLNAWDRIQELGKRTESYIRVKQGQREFFTDFLQRLTKSVQLGVTDCQMDVFHFAEFGKLNMYTTLLTLFLGFQWATALSSEKADPVITHLLEVMAIMSIPAQIKTDNGSAYASWKNETVFCLLQY